MAILRKIIRVMILEATHNNDVNAIFRQFAEKFNDIIGGTEEHDGRFIVLAETNPVIPYLDTKAQFIVNHQDEYDNIESVKEFIDKMKDDDIAVLMYYFTNGTATYKATSVNKLASLIKIARTSDEFEILAKRSTGDEIEVANDMEGEEELYGYAFANREEFPEDED